MRQRLADGKAELDLTRFPVVILTEQGILSETQRIEVTEAIDELIDRRGRHALVLDMSAAGALPESQRVYVAEHSKLRAAELCAKRAALAVVVRPPLLHHVPVAAYWLRVSPVPAKVFTHLEEAATWARSYVVRTQSGEVVTPLLTGQTTRTRNAR